jgi:DNA repair photolyase
MERVTVLKLDPAQPAHLLIADVTGWTGSDFKSRSCEPDAAPIRGRFSVIAACRSLRASCGHRRPGWDRSRSAA